MPLPAITLADRFSHEFRTPLTVIKEYATLMRDGIAGGPVSSRHQHMLSVIDDRADDLHGLVDNMLHLARFQDGDVHLDRQPIELDGLLDTMDAEMRHKAEWHNCSMRLDVAADLPPVFFDEDHLTRILLNLVVHALKNRAEADELLLSCAKGKDDDHVSLAVSVDASPEDGLNESSPLAMGLGLGVADQLAAINLGRLEIELRPTLKLSARIPVYESLAIGRRFLSWLTSTDNPPAAAAVVSVSAIEQLNPKSGGEIDRLLRYVIKVDELLMREEDQWVIITPVRANEEPTIQQRIEETFEEMGLRLAAPLPAIRMSGGGVHGVADSANELLDAYAQAMRRGGRTPADKSAPF